MKAFFSYDIDRDGWRAQQVRDAWLAQAGGGATGFWDASVWEAARKRGSEAVKRLIDEALADTSVTMLLIGTDTASQDYVEYAIIQSCAKTPRHGVVGIYIHDLKDKDGSIDAKGLNPLDAIYVSHDGFPSYLSFVYPTYDWVQDEGRKHLPAWVEEAANTAVMRVP
jgi:hypothetical protein